jgi:hypothetical protein
MTAQWPVPAGLHRASSRLPIEGELPDLDGVTGWLNSAPLTADGLQGRVVLVNFWTYTCINWLRQLSLCPRLECQVRRPRPGDGWHAHASSSSRETSNISRAVWERVRPRTTRARRISGSDTFLPRPIDRRRSR